MNIKLKRFLNDAGKILGVGSKFRPTFLDIQWGKDHKFVYAECASEHRALLGMHFSPVQFDFLK